MVETYQKIASEEAKLALGTAESKRLLTMLYKGYNEIARFYSEHIQSETSTEAYKASYRISAALETYVMACIRMYDTEPRDAFLSDATKGLKVLGNITKDSRYVFELAQLIVDRGHPVGELIVRKS